MQDYGGVTGKAVDGVKRWHDEMRAAGLRVTRPRLAVLAEVRDHPHADVAEIAAGARGRLGALSTQAVYDAVHVLTQVGLLRCVELAGSPARFELQTGDNHHHAVCRSCGAIADIGCVASAAPCLRSAPAGDGVGYLIDEAEVTFWGICPDCQVRNSPTDWRSA